MDNKEFARQFENRTKKFAIRVIKLSASLPDTIEGKVIRNQITKSGTSIGANYREANRSRSKADFTNKIKICESESNETVYWLEIIQELSWVENGKIKEVIIEVNELLSVFASIGKTLNSGSPKL